MSQQHQTLINRVHNLQKALGWKKQPASDFNGWDFMKFIKVIRKLEDSLLARGV